MLLNGAEMGRNVAILLCGANVVVWRYAPRSQNANHRGAVCAHSLTSELAASFRLAIQSLKTRVQI